MAQGEGPDSEARLRRELDSGSEAHRKETGLDSLKEGGSGSNKLGDSANRREGGSVNRSEEGSGSNKVGTSGNLDIFLLFFDYLRAIW